MPVGALSPRRPHAARPRRARRGDRTGERNHGRGGRPRGATGFSRPSARAPERAGIDAGRSSLAASLPTGRSRRSCISARRRSTPTRGGCMHLLSAPLPVTVAVHIRVGSRAQSTRPPAPALEAAVAPRSTTSTAERSCRLRRARSARRSRAARRRARRRDRRDRLQGRGSLRDPGPATAGPKRSTRLSKRRRGNSRRSPTPGSIRGRWRCLPGLTSTMPLGIDPLRATRSYAQRNIAALRAADLRAAAAHRTG